MRLDPFRALRPAPQSVADVAAPPYDVVSRAEAASLAKGNPISFLRVVRAEIDLPDETDAHDPRVYAQARQNLDRLITDGVLVEEREPTLYLYREIMDGRAQAGVVGCVHVDDYERGVIKKHETTRPDKEDDRTRHILALGAHAEPVLLAYRGHEAVARLNTIEMARAPLYDLTTADGVRHTVWRLTDPAPYVRAFEEVPSAYVADGHHRSASASRAARERRAAGDARGSRGLDASEYDRFPAALVPGSELRILAYNRVITDLGGRTAADVIGRLAAAGHLSPSETPSPPRPKTVCVYVGRRWHLLEFGEPAVGRDDAVGSLDVSLLQERVLGPVFGIVDQRTDTRIDFIGGIRGARELESRVDSGEAAIAISMFPTGIEQLMAVSDAGHMMPPKSTWFEPKLLGGLFVHLAGNR